jgi:hypothetical protein
MKKPRYWHEGLSIFLIAKSEKFLSCKTRLTLCMLSFPFSYNLSRFYQHLCVFLGNEEYFQDTNVCFSLSTSKIHYSYENRIAKSMCQWAFRPGVHNSIFLDEKQFILHAREPELMCSYIFKDVFMKETS